MRISTNFSPVSSCRRFQSAKEVRNNSDIRFESPSNMPAIRNMITFGGNKDKSSVVHIALELPPYCKGGGVGTYMEDLRQLNHWIDDYSKKHPECADTLKGAKNNHIIIPYYNGKVLKDGSVEVRTLDINGVNQPVYVAPDVSKTFATRWDELAQHPDKYTPLEKVTSFDMDWGIEKTPVTLYKAKRSSNKDSNLHEYMVFCDKTARMKKPYDSNSGAACYSSERGKPTQNKTGHLEFDEVVNNAKKMQKNSRVAELTSSSSDQMFCKAAIEAIEKANINAETVLASDAHAAYAPEYAAQRAVRQGSDYYKDVKFAVVEHNYGNGYLSIDSAKNFIMSLATPEQVKMIENNPNYIAAKKMGGDQVEAFFRQFCKQCYDDNGDVNPYVMSLKQTSDKNGSTGNVVRVFTVSDEAFQSILDNPETSPLHGRTVETYKENPSKVGGIINGLSNPKASPREELPFSRYTGIFKEKDYVSEEVNGATKYFALDKKDDTGKPTKGTELKVIETVNDDKGKVVPKRFSAILRDNNEVIEVKPFRTYFDNLSLDEFKKRIEELKNGATITDAELKAYKEVTNHNKMSMLQRIIYMDKFGDSSWIAGLPGKNCKVIGGFDPKFLDMIKKGEAVPMVVDWSRVDKQKGFEQAIETIKEATKKHPNLIALFGGEIDENQPVPKAVKKRLEELTAGDLKGRFAFVDGFAPGFSFASSAEFAMFTPTFAPCDLTDPEAMKKLAILIVNDTQGLKQKNFDINNPAENAFFNAYKTKNEYYGITSSKIDEIINTFAKSEHVESPATLTEELKATLQKVYPNSCDNDFELFRKFGKKFDELFIEFESEAADRLKADQLNEVKTDALALLKSSEKYSNFVNDLKVAILTNETTACLENALKDLNNDEILKAFLKNMLIADPGWAGNVYANPKTGLSSAELYVKTLILPNLSTPNMTVVNIDETLKNMDKYNLSNALGDVFVNTNTTNKTAAGNFMTKIKEAVKDKRILATLGGIAVVGGIAAGLIHSKNKKSKTAQPQVETINSFTVEQPSQALPPVPPLNNMEQTSMQAPIMQQPMTMQPTVSNQPPKKDLSGNKFAACFNRVA